MCVQLSADTRSRQLRSLRSAARNDLLNPTHQDFAVFGPTCWNSLPPQLKSASLTLQQFSDRLKTVGKATVFSHSYERCRHHFVNRSPWSRGQIDTVLVSYGITIIRRQWMTRDSSCEGELWSWTTSRETSDLKATFEWSQTTETWQEVCDSINRK